jgi:hypothetical protein
MTDGRRTGPQDDQDPTMSPQGGTPPAPPSTDDGEQVPSGSAGERGVDAAENPPAPAHGYRPPDGDQ